MKFVDGQQLELTGELVDISPRFYAQGWGYGTLRLSSGKTIKITGTLQGKEVGERLIVNGIWSAESKYGPQLQAQVITPDFKNGTTSHIRSWFRKIEKELFLSIRVGSSTSVSNREELREDCDLLCQMVDEEKRWDVLSSEVALAALGVKHSTYIAERAQTQLKLYRKIAELQSWGFTDPEIHKLGEKALDVVDAKTTYLLVLAPVSFSFATVDRIAKKVWQVPLKADIRMRTGVYAALKEVESNGNTAASIDECARQAAKILEVYDEQVYEWLSWQDFSGTYVDDVPLEMNFRLWNLCNVQLAATAAHEIAISDFVRKFRHFGASFIAKERRG
jgi:exodeoxyribonuclease V alpha subunit